MEINKEKTGVISGVLKGLKWLEDNISALFLGSAVLLLFTRCWQGISLIRRFMCQQNGRRSWSPGPCSWGMPY